MKIATITCHDVYNYGASLQAYALQEYCKSLGCEYEIIDYKPDYLSQHFRLGLVANPKYDKPVLKQLYLLAKLPGRLRNLKRKKAFDEFTSKYLDKSPVRYNCYEELTESPPMADLYIAGSDQIWNTKFKNGRDASFYLSFAPSNSIIVSYAASFATRRVEADIEAFVKSKLARFDCITVREASGVKIVRDFGLNAQKVVDPVFLLSIKTWNNIAKKYNGSYAPYLLVYDFQKSDSMRKIAKKIARIRRLKIFSISPFKLDYADRNFAYESPESFLGLIKDADCIINNSFHGTAFSILFKKEFYFINREDGLNERMLDFLTTYGLKDRIVTEKTSEDLFVKAIDYETIGHILNQDIQLSKSIIDGWVEKCKRCD